MAHYNSDMLPFENTSDQGSDHIVEPQELLSTPVTGIRLRIPARNPHSWAEDLPGSDIDEPKLDTVFAPSDNQGAVSKHKRNASTLSDTAQSTDFGPSKKKKKQREKQKSRSISSDVDADLSQEDDHAKLIRSQPNVRVALGGTKHKFVKQDPILFGPVDFDTNTEWSTFQEQVAEVSETTVECLNVPSFTWRWTKPANSPWMPLSSGNAFDTLKRKLTHKLVVIMVNMKAPCAPDKIQPPWAANDTSPWTSQIKMPAGFDTTADDTTAKGRTDEQLEELVARLEEKYPEGLCTVHPDKCCFHQ
ncbi:hypothetical protein K439DRAFT_1622455 [Ramaria rubella]|nr:hypothetical protein K439DRAFT_1622455 [Ramaria rubella]